MQKNQVITQQKAQLEQVEAQTQLQKLHLEAQLKKDLMPFYFKDLRDNSYIYFRAYIEGLSENISPSYASLKSNQYTLTFWNFIF